MPKPIREVLSDFHADIKEKKKGKVVGNKVINTIVTAAVGAARRPEIYQTIFGGVSDTGTAAGTAMKGSAADLKKVSDSATDQAGRDVAGGLSGALSGCSELVDKVGEFLKSGTDASKTNMAGATSIASAAESIGLKAEGLSDNLQSSADGNSFFKQLAMMTRQLSRACFALGYEAVHYRRLNRTKLNFHYWLKIELAKRRLMQEHLGVLNLVEKDLLEKKENKKILADIDSDKFPLADMKVKLLGEAESEKTDLPEKFRKRLYAALEKLMSLQTEKIGQRTEDDIAYLKENQALLDFIKDTTLGAKPSAIDENKVKCLVLRLEQEQAVKLLAKYNERIEKRIIHRLESKRDDVEAYQANKEHIERRLVLNEKIEKVSKELIPKKFSKIAGDLKQLQKKVKNPDLVTDEEKKKAKEFDKEYDRQHKAKLVKGKNSLTANALLIASFTVGIASVITAFALLSNPVALPVVGVMALVGLVLYKVAQKKQPDVVSKLNKTMGQLFSKITGQLRLQDRVKLMKKEFKDDQLSKSITSVEKEDEAQQAEVAMPALKAGTGLFKAHAKEYRANPKEELKLLDSISQKIDQVSSDLKSQEAGTKEYDGVVDEMKKIHGEFEQITERYGEGKARPLAVISKKIDMVREKMKEMDDAVEEVRQGLSPTN